MMPEHYLFTNGWTARREKPHPHFWLLLDGRGKCIDRDRYRHDLISRHDLIVKAHVDPLAEPRSVAA